MTQHSWSVGDFFESLSGNPRDPATKKVYGVVTSVDDRACTFASGEADYFIWRGIIPEDAMPTHLKGDERDEVRMALLAVSVTLGSLGWVRLRG